MTDLEQWFKSPRSTLTSPQEENPIGITPGLMGADFVEPIPDRPTMINLNMFITPWRVLFNRSKATLTGN